MHTNNLTRNGFKYYWRQNLAIILCVVTGTAVLTGSLLVGDSMRGSLRNLALQRLGPITHAMISNRFIREESVVAAFKDSAHLTAFPAVFLGGSIHHADSKARVNKVNVLGVHEDFKRLWGTPESEVGPRETILNQRLASELGAKVGDDVLLRIVKHGTIPSELLLGRPDDASATIRLKVRSIVANDGYGGFSPRPNQVQPRNVFVPVATLQRIVDQPGRVNTILAVVDADDDTSPAKNPQTMLKEGLGLPDYRLRIRRDRTRGYFSLESEGLLLEPAVEAAANEAAAAVGIQVTPVLTYLANGIAKPTDSPDGGIPYSTITALDPQQAASLRGASAKALEKGRILLNQWSADDLGVGVGDAVRVTFYVSGRFGALETREARFELAGVLPMDEWSADPGFMPVYEGISNATNLADWDPPPSFKIDLNRIRDKDETYWDDHRGTPKAIVSLEDGLALWTQQGSRFGRYTALQFGPDADESIKSFNRELRARLDPEDMGLVFEPVRRQAIASSGGSTDFSGLFISFSFFLIVAAAMLVALVFRLGLERRSSEVGLLLAVGFSPKRVSRQFLIEAAWPAGIGSLLGLAAASGYAWLMLSGLKTWWAAAVNAPFLQLHVAPLSLAIGALGGFLVAMLSIAWSLRGILRLTPRALMSGTTSSGRSQGAGKRARWTLIIALCIGATLLAGSAFTEAIPQVAAFFTAGAALLVAGLAAFFIRLGSPAQSLIRSQGIPAMWRLGRRNATRNSGRSVLTAGLIAGATFVIVAVGASRHEVGSDALQKSAGSGGYSLVAEAAIPLQYDPGTTEGRDELNLSLEPGVKFHALRLKPGDDASCRNLYKVKRPRIVGASDTMIARGGFAFSKSLAESDEETANPWRLLDRSFDDGAIPAIGDANTLTWLIKVGLGEDLVITDDRGREQRLRIVGMLSGSILQGELVVNEDRFGELFPTVTGYAFGLVETREQDAESIRKLAMSLESQLSDSGLDAISTIDLLNEYRAVENTYMSTFQTLGGLGLVLGTIGLAAVMLRNVIERRSELALLRAIGYSHAGLGWMVFAENAALLSVGLLIGAASALLAVSPHALSQPQTIDWASLAGTLVLVAIVGLASCGLALRTALRTPLLPALRTE